MLLREEIVGHDADVDLGADQVPSKVLLVQVSHLVHLCPLKISIERQVNETGRDSRPCGQNNQRFPFSFRSNYLRQVIVNGQVDVISVVSVRAHF